MSTGTVVGNLGSPWLATVDERGVVRTKGCTLDWWIAAEDRWHFASTEPSSRIRQRRIDDTPVVETAIRVPGGEAVLRAYAAVVDGEDLVIAEVENASKVPFAVAFGISGRRLSVRLPRPPSRTDAPDGAPPADRVIVYPLPHTARLRIASVLAPLRRGIPRVNGARMQGEAPSPEEVARGWVAHRDQGVRAVVPDARFQHEIDYQRCLALLDPDAGHDRWQQRLWDERRDGIGLLPEMPADWRGQGIEVHDAPTRHGHLSYAVRWHGARPALLWDVERPTTLTVPTLDPSWSTNEARGEVLLA